MNRTFITYAGAAWLLCGGAPLFSEPQRSFDRGNAERSVDEINESVDDIDSEEYGTVGLSDEDCNGNQIADGDEIAADLRLDCDGDGYLDVCDLLDNDCNFNGIPDQCDPDADEDGFPDDCTGAGAVTTSAVTPTAPPAPHDRNKNRYISFKPNNGSNAVAFQVVKQAAPIGGGFCTTSGLPCTGLWAMGSCAAGQLCIPPHLFSPAGGCWVQEPVQTGNAIFTAKCDSTPVVRVWTEQVIHVGDCEIIPMAEYSIYAFSATLALNPTPYNTRTIEMPSLNAKASADTVGTFNGGEWTPPNRFTNINDVFAILAFISGLAGKPQFPVVNLQATSGSDSCLNLAVNVGDVLAAVQGVAGAHYGPPSTTKITDPANCPVCP